MKTKIGLMSAVSALCLFAVMSCNSDSDPDSGVDGDTDSGTNGGTDSGTNGDTDGGTDSDTAGDSADDDGGDSNGDDESEYAFRENLGVIFEAAMGDRISFDTMGTLSERIVWDFELFSEGGPAIRLGMNVTGLDNGNAADFHDVDAAPEGESYMGDNLPDYVIGNGFRNGGSGSEGFVMTQNVYILKRADGSYAKLEVLSAKNGIFGFHIYHQPDGTTDLSTHEDPGATDVWAHVVINCGTACNTDKVVIYGNAGSALGDMPTFMNTWEEDIQFPFHAVITQTGMTGTGSISEGEHVLRAYQDLDSEDGMGRQDGDPVSRDVVVDFRAGEWNLLTFDLE